MLKPELVDRAVEAIKGYAQYQYFFENADSPEWLEPLAARNFFKNPPPPEKINQYVRLPFWPESRYLVRMAAVPEAQPMIVQITRQIPKTENSRVYDDIVDIALALPAEQAVELLDQIERGLQLPMKLILEDRIGDLIKRLAIGGQASAALRLSRLILVLAPDPRAERQDEERTILRPEPQPVVRDWYYARIIEKSLKPLVQVAGLDALQLYVDLLDSAISLSRKASEKTDADEEEDYLYISCPNIEHGNGRDDIPVILIAAVRDAAEEVITIDATQFVAVIQLLDSKPWSTFRRIKLHLCRVFPELGLPIAEAILTDGKTLLRGSLQHEIVLLLKASFGHFSEETQRRILSIMDAGASEDTLRTWLEFIEQPVTDENIKHLADMGRRDRYAILQGQLPADYQQKLNQLVAQLGDPRALGEPKIGKFGAIGAQSPKSEEELEAMSVEEILDFALSWKAGMDIFQPTAEGLGKALTGLVTKNPAPFLVHAKRFEVLDPTYVRALLGGLHGALKAHLAFDWQPVLELSAGVVKQSCEIPGRKGELMVTDPDWGWTRNSILDLLTTGFELGLAGHLTHDMHPLVWQILESLTDDSNPSTADERGKNFDTSFLSINSTRGRAMHAVFEYARWRRLSTDPERIADNKPPLSFDDMPEVRKTLEAHLDVNREPTLTIRSVYGHHLNLTAALDLGWLRANLHRIFPADALPLFDAAWDDYISSNQPNTTLLPLLIPFHQRALERLGRKGNNKHHRDPADALAEHLMVYYWSSRIDFDSPDSLLKEFYERASDDIRGHAMWYVGTSVPGWTDAPPEAYIHLQELFDRRLSAAKNAASPNAFQKELRKFGHWFISEKFDERWSVDTLLAVLEIGEKAEPDVSVVKRLADLCLQYPFECIAAVRLMIEGDREGWLLLGVEEDVRQIIKGALESKNEDGVRAGRLLIESLIAKGQFGFRELLS